MLSLRGLRDESQSEGPPSGRVGGLYRRVFAPFLLLEDFLCPPDFDLDEVDLALALFLVFPFAAL